MPAGRRWEIRTGEGMLLKFSRIAFIGVALALAPAPSRSMEKIAIPSLDGRLELAGYWFPVTSAQALPAVISLHGCGGMLDGKGAPVASAARDAGYANAENIHWLALDSFTPRGLKSICEIPQSRRTVNEETRRGDVYAALQWLARQPGVDRSRIAILGRSHGAQTVLSAINGGEAWVRAQPLLPSAAIALYPGCTRFNAMKGYELAAPLSLMSGELDDWTPARPCVQLHDRLARAGKDMRFDIKVYPGSYHGFDGTAPVRVRTGLGIARGSAHVGGNPEARAAAHARIFEFLSSQWQMPLLLTHEERMKRPRNAPLQRTIPQPSN